MDYDRLWTIAEQARKPGKLSPADAAFVRTTVPEALATFPRLTLPKSIRHPGGFTVSGAPVGTFLRSALLLAGQKVHGRRYPDAPFYEKVENDLALGIMRSHFHNGYPKGAFCCGQCTLAVYPVLVTGAIRWFDGAPLARGIVELIEAGEWRFKSPANPRMLTWSLGQSGRPAAS